MRITPTFLEGVLNVPDSIVARSRIRPLVALLLLATMLLAACGGTPTQSAEADDEPAGTEAEATGSDIVAVNGVEAVILDREGLFAPLEIDVEGYPAEQVENTWAWTYINAYAPWWNTSRVAESDIPTSWE